MSPEPLRRNTDPVAYRELQELKAWRDRAVTEGRVQFGAIKDADLARIVTHGRRDERVVQSILSSAVRHLAAEMVEVQLEVGRRGLPRPAVTPSTARAQPPSVPDPLSRSTGPSTAQPPVPAAPQAAAPPPPQRAGSQASTSQADGRLAAAAANPPRAAPATTTQRDPVSASAEGLPRADLNHFEEEETPVFAPVRRVDRAARIHPIKITEIAKGVRLRWPADNEEVDVLKYRVVSRDDLPPFSPDSSTLVQVTTELTAVDDRAAVGAVRHFAVFANAGMTEDEAYEAQPRLVAEGIHVFPVQDLDLRVEEGRLIAQWNTLPGASRVLVYRLPVAQLAPTGVGDEEHLINRDEDNLRGFVDSHAVPGQTYRYDFVVEIQQGDVTRHSAATSTEKSIPAPLTPITDLSVERQYAADGSVTFDLSWTKPRAGSVVIFCTELGPVAGAMNEAHEIGALGLSLRLKDADQQRLPVRDLGGGRAGMRDVKGKNDWHRIHFTPVTVLNGRARVGRTVPQLVIGDPLLPEIVERCDYQVLKFGWPMGAAKVIAVTRRPEEPVSSPIAGGVSYCDIDEETWRGLGGLQLPQRLPPGGCRLDLAGVAWDQGDAEVGRTVSVSYPGLLRVRYRIEARTRSILFDRRLEKVIVKLTADRETSSVPDFVLVHHPSRLPLHPNDGRPLPVVLDIPQVTPASQRFRPERLTPSLSAVGWSADTPGFSGYVRLFVVGTGSGVALLDPPPQELQLRS